MAADLGSIRAQVILDIRRAVAAYAALRAQNARTTYALRGTGDSFVQAGQTMGVAGAGMVYAFGKVVMAAAEFERKMDFASAVSGTTGQKMQELSDYALELGKNTIYSAGEIADGFIELAKAGVSAEQIMNGIGEAMANLGAAGDIPLAQSGQIITSTIQQYDLAAKDAVKVTDLLAGAANASIADISDIGVSLKYVGGVANAAGLSFEDTSTAISLLAKAGIRGSTAGTSLRQMIVSLGGATEPARDALTELGILTEDGSNKFFTAEGNAKSLAQVFQILQNSTADLTAKQRLMYLRTIFNNRALSAASILTRDGAKGFREMNREMLKTTAADVAAERLDNLSGDIEILRGNIETLMVEQGGPFQETMRGWVQAITRLIQAFGELDPATQKFILQSIGIGGAALVVMGALSIVIGVVARFIAAMLKMGAAVKFLFSMLRILVFNLRFAAAIFAGPLAAAIGAIGAPIWLIVGAIAALVAGFVLAYKNIEGFRNVVNSVVDGLGNALKAIGSFFLLLVTDPKKAFEQIKGAASSFISSIGNFFARLPGLIGGYLGSAVSAVGNFIAGVGRWFAALPGRVIGAVTSFVSQVTSLLTFRNIGYAIGFMVGTVVRFFITMGTRVLSAVTGMVLGVIGFIARLPARVGYLIGFMIGRAIGLMIRFAARMIATAGRVVTGTIRFFQQLPGRVAAFVSSMVSRGVALMVSFATRLPSLAAQLVSNVINFIQNLPGRVAGFIGTMAARARGLFEQFRQNAVTMAQNAAQGFMSALQGLPGQVAGIVGNLISAFKDKIGDAAAAVRDFAKGMWEGFKDGIGMHSPSHIERAMWQITGVVDKETKKLAKKTMEVQALSKRMAKTSFSVGDPGAPSGARRYAELASMQSRNLMRARTLAEASGKRQAARRASPNRQGRDRIVSGELDLTPNGRAFIRGVAEEVYDDNDSFEGTTGRMR